MKVAAVIEYDGSKFSGFQRQKEISNTIVENIEKALKELGINSKVVGSGRTDKGVHATFQVVSFDIPQYWQAKAKSELKYRLNQKLNYIRFKYIKKVSSSFHAQYSAKVRVYRYLIKTTQPTVFEKDYVSYYQINDIKKLKEAIELFRGKHNFKYFKKEGSVTSSDIREIYKTKVTTLNRDYIAIHFFANGYLRSQIRLMVAAALDVECGNIKLSDIKEQLNLTKKSSTKLATPNGLYLARVFY
jgi:tRNA pseudouridine38-40 synthase